MRHRMWLRVLTLVAIGTVVLGLALTALLLDSEHIRSLVLCTDPEAFTCSGHYVRGVPNEVWSVALTLSGVALLIVSRVLRRRTPAVPPPAT